MSKRNTKIQSDVQSLFSSHKAYSVSEILAAGGTTAFANKMGKRPENIVDRLKELPEDAFLTEEEATLALKMLKDSK